MTPGWPQVDPACFQRSKQKHDKLLSKVAVKFNLRRYTKELTKVEDYVVFKLDIDAPFVEIALVRQIMDDPQLISLIDEFYFEHHVTGSPMQWHGWGNLTALGAPLGDIQDSYDIFTFLRETGMRAHSWV